MSGVLGELTYQTGIYQALVPQFLPDTVVIRPHGEYGLYPGGVYSGLGGGYWYNANSYATDPASGPMADIVYLVENDLKLLPTVKRVLIAIYWYTSLDLPNWDVAVGGAIGPEVQSWDWLGTPPPSLWVSGPWNRNNAYYLQGNHKVWPTPDDPTLVSGIQYLEGQGYQVGLLPINALISRNIYAPNLGEYQVDRIAKVWSNPAKLATFLSYYEQFINHYIDLCAKNNIRPWLFSIGSGMRDLMNVPDVSQFPGIISMFQGLLRYCKQQLPNTLTAYFADIDEYYYLFGVQYNPGYLDPLWTMPELDRIGINWFAPLVLDDSEDIATLRANVFRGEGYDYWLPTIPWRSTQQLPDRVITATTNTFKTGIGQQAITPRANGCKALEDWLVFNHYYPITPGILAGCTPPAGICANDPRVCTPFQGDAAVLSDEAAINPSAGGIAPGIDFHAAYLQINLGTKCTIGTPAQIPDNSTLAFSIDFGLNALVSDSTKDYRLLYTASGFTVEVNQEVVTIYLPQSDGSLLAEELFTFWSGRIDLTYTAGSVDISVNGAFDRTVTPASGLTFVMPQPKQTVTLGNPVSTPSGYTPWVGRVYYLKFLLGSGDNLSGGEYHFEDAYNGVRTAWVAPAVKPWIAITGYGSIHGSAADPFTRPEVITWSSGPNIPAGYEDGANLNAAVFWNGWHAANIRGPYGSDFSIDEVYQAIALYSAVLGLEPASPEHIGAWFFDTRSPTAHLVTMPTTKWQVYTDAYDGEIDASLNGKAGVRGGGTNLQYTAVPTVDNMLGLSQVPGVIPAQRVIITEPGVVQQ